MRILKRHFLTGEIRQKTFFAWLPITLYNPNGNMSETRWLERVTIEQRYECGWDGQYWNNLRFIDNGNHKS